jgi:hypothetical protein
MLKQDRNVLRWSSFSHFHHTMRLPSPDSHRHVWLLTQKIAPLLIRYDAKSKAGFSARAPTACAVPARLPEPLEARPPLAPAQSHSNLQARA